MLDSPDLKNLKNLETAAEVIDALGSAQTRRLTGASIASLSNWKAAGRLPPRTFLVLTDALREAGAAAPSELWGIKPVKNLGI